MQSRNEATPLDSDAFWFVEATDTQASAYSLEERLAHHHQQQQYQPGNLALTAADDDEDLSSLEDVMYGSEIDHQPLLDANGPVCAFPDVTYFDDTSRRGQEVLFHQYQYLQQKQQNHQPTQELYCFLPKEPIQDHSMFQDMMMEPTLERVLKRQVSSPFSVRLLEPTRSRRVSESSSPTPLPPPPALLSFGGSIPPYDVRLGGEVLHSGRIGDVGKNIASFTRLSNNVDFAQEYSFDKPYTTSINDTIKLIPSSISTTTSPSSSSRMAPPYPSSPTAGSSSAHNSLSSTTTTINNPGGLLIGGLRNDNDAGDDDPLERFDDDDDDVHNPSTADDIDLTRHHQKDGQDELVPSSSSSSPTPSSNNILPPWSVDLHRDFVRAVFEVGLLHSSPSVIAEHMVLPKVLGSIMCGNKKGSIIVETTPVTTTSNMGPSDASIISSKDNKYNNNNNNKCSDSNQASRPDIGVVAVQSDCPSPVLTSEQIKSHLQKFRRNRKRELDTFLTDHDLAVSAWAVEEEGCAGGVMRSSTSEDLISPILSTREHRDVNPNSSKKKKKMMMMESSPTDGLVDQRISLGGYGAGLTTASVIRSQEEEYSIHRLRNNTGQMVSTEPQEQRLEHVQQNNPSVGPFPITQLLDLGNVVECPQLSDAERDAPLGRSLLLAYGLLQLCLNVVIGLRQTDDVGRNCGHIRIQDGCPNTTTENKNIK